MDNNRITSEYLSDVIDATITVSSAVLMTITCFSSPLSAHDLLLDSTRTIMEYNPLLPGKKQKLEIEDEIAALKEEEELYHARAEYASRESSRMLDRDIAASKEYAREALRCKEKEAKTRAKIDELIHKLEKIEEK